MRTGALNYPITIERRVKVGAKSLGNPNFVWQTFLEIFSEVTVLRGREHFDPQTKQRFSEDVYHFCCHYDDVIGLDATMRVLDEDGQRYDIKSVRPDLDEKRECIIECTKQDAVVGAVALSAYIDDEIATGTAGAAYQGFFVAAVGGTAPYTFSVSGSLPTGLALNTSTGEVAGTPTVPGTFTVTFSVTDAAADTHAMPALEIVVA